MEDTKPRTFTPEEYLELDDAAPEGVRLEYFDGHIYLGGQVFDPAVGWDVARDLAGATPDHNRLKNNVETALTLLLRDRDCDVYSSDQRVRVGRTDSYVYPDVIVSCDGNDDGVMLTNPDLLVEILSESTAENDLSRKMAEYAEMDSVKEYWFISQKEVRVIQCFRSGEGWGFRHYSDLGLTLRSEAMRIELPLSEIYRRVL